MSRSLWFDRDRMIEAASSNVTARKMHHHVQLDRIYEASFQT
jgi:hypothetical protein